MIFKKLTVPKLFEFEYLILDPTNVSDFLDYLKTLYDHIDD